MQRVTITLDDDLLETLDSLSQRRGYNNRSEAIRDILRSALAQEATQQHGTQGFAVLSYVYEHEKTRLSQPYCFHPASSPRPLRRHATCAHQPRRLSGNRRVER